MIQRLRSLFSGILRRILPATRLNANEFEGKPALKRHIEIIVERESLSVVQPGEPARRPGGGASGQKAAEALCRKLPQGVQSPASPPVVKEEQSADDAVPHKARGSK